MVSSTSSSLNSLRVTRWPHKSKDPAQNSTTSRDAYVVTLTGFLIVGIATPTLGWALHREVGLSRLKSLGIADLGPASVIIGSGFVGHIPSGTASILLIAAIVFGITGLPDASPVAARA